MKILILDVYPDRPYRICKDNNGGFGTANDYGDGIVARALAFMVAHSIDFPPLHAVYTMGALKRAGHYVRYARTYDGSPTDLCILPSSIVAHETELDAVRSMTAQDITVAVTGPFASAMPEPYIEGGGIVLSGEPEMFFHDFDMSIEAFQELGPLHKIEEKVKLDELAYPAWEDIFTAAKTKMGFLGGSGAIPITSSRGCPYSCFNYCTYPLQQGRTLRRRDPASVATEMVHWHKVLGVDRFLFRDPVFSTDRKHVEAVCDAIMATGIPFRFGVELHLKDMDEALADRLYDAGLRLVYTGIESVTQEVIEDAKRMSIDSDLQRKKVEMLEGKGIRVKAMYIFGFPADTPETVDRTLEYARRLKSTYAQFSIFTPYPGTPIFQNYRNRITAERYEEFTQWQLVFRHESFTPVDIRQLLDRAFTSYYTNLPWLLKTAGMYFLSPFKRHA